MTFDLVASIGMTACAAVAIAAVSVGSSQLKSTRLLIAAGLAGWFSLVTVMAAAEALHNEREFGALGVGVAVLMPIVILGVTVMRSPALHKGLREIPLSLLVGINAIRVFGATFVLLYAAGRLPAPFAPVAGWGDILVGLTALPVAWLLSRGAAARPVVWIWNSVGLLDLIVAVGLGAASSPGPVRMIFAEPGSGIMTTLPWLLIPGFLVPLLAATHLAVFYRLRSVATTGRRRAFPREQPATV